ncbi:3036_t:CDS:1, partial [Gigaspora margarita]
MSTDKEICDICYESKSRFSFYSLWCDCTSKICFSCAKKSIEKSEKCPFCNLKIKNLDIREISKRKFHESVNPSELDNFFLKSKKYKRLTYEDEIEILNTKYINKKETLKFRYNVNIEEIKKEYEEKIASIDHEYESQVKKLNKQEKARISDLK